MIPSTLEIQNFIFISIIHRYFLPYGQPNIAGRGGLASQVLASRLISQTENQDLRLVDRKNMQKIRSMMHGLI